MKPEFHDDYINPEGSPLEPQIADFDWTSLYYALGEPTEERNGQDYSALGMALHELMKFVVQGEVTEGRRYEREVARRVISLAWVVSPSLFDDNPSLTKLSRALRLNTPEMSSHTAAVSKRFQLVNGAQAHGWNRK